MSKRYQKLYYPAKNVPNRSNLWQKELKPSYYYTYAQQL